MLKKVFTLSSKATLFAFCIITVLGMLALIGMLSVHHAHSIQDLSKTLTKCSIFFAIWRYLVMLVIVYFYPKIIEKLFADNVSVDKELLAKCIQRRWVISALVIYEVLVVQNVLSPFVNWVLGLS